MKRVSWFILCVILIFSLCACSNGNGDLAVMATTNPLNIAESLTLGYDGKGGAIILTDDGLKKLSEYDEIRSLVLVNYIGTDLGVLKQVKGLERLKLQSMENLTDLSFLTELTELKFLMINDLSDEFTDISVLSKLTWLEELSVNNISVEDFSPLYSLKRLKTLDLTSTAMTQPQYDALKIALPDCEIKNVTIYND